jgi:hypothetical protein
MTEDYLHYIWKFQKLDHSNIKTTEDEPILIKKIGFHNHDAGPDFLEAHISINTTEWFGSVEIHVRASDWRRHKHHEDPAYNNVVLHVVYEDDEAIFNMHGEKIPTLELKNCVDHNAYFDYERFLQTNQVRPCSLSIKNVPKFTVVNVLDEMLVKRLLRKSADIQNMLEQTNYDWEQVFHQLLFKYLGMKVNAGAMLELAQRTPYRLLQKNKRLRAMEALLFGQAGMLNTATKDDYHQELREEYLFLKQKFQLTAMTGNEWKFSRMRPPNFPTLRIAQLAAIYNINQNLFEIIRDKISLRHIQLVLSATPSAYWETHYSFKSESKEHKGNLGKVALHNMIINVIAPFAFYYGETIGDDDYKDYALLLLERIPGEQNKITKTFNDFDLGILSAKDSQALIQLDNELCQNKKCLGCKIGVYLLHR